MRTLETTRVCIIDDEEKEYLPLIHALSRLRLGVLHVGGDKVEDLPPPGEPLDGLRLVFLDMQLGLEGEDDAAVTAHTAQVFSRVVSRRAGPLLVVIWTKHEDMVELFQKRLYEHYPEYLGKLLFARIEKPAGDLDPNELRSAISEVMQKFYPAEILWRWEQLVHEAASATTEEISKHACTRAAVGKEDSEEECTKKLQQGLQDLLRILISAEAEETISAQTAFADLLNVLNPLHHDRLEHAVEALDAKVAEALITGTKATSTKAEKLELNTMLFVAQHLASGHPFRPGTVFRISNPVVFEARFKISIPNVFGELLDVPKPDGWNDAKQQLESGKLTRTNLKKAEEVMSEKDLKLQADTQKLLARCEPILLDISPPCDFAQRHPRFARLVAGLMVPADGGIKYHKKDSFRTIRTVKIPSRDGGWDSVFCSRFTFTVPTTAAMEELEPFWRLRDPILTDIRYWCSAQDARLGYVVF